MSIAYGGQGQSLTYQTSATFDRVVRGTVEETLNALLDAEADRLCNAQRFERSEAHRDTRAGHYERGLQNNVKRHPESTP